MNKITKEDIHKYGNWYPLIEDQLFANLLAACSQRKQVKANWNLAKRVYEYALLGFPIPKVGILPCAERNIQRALNGEELSGRKVRAFSENLKGNLNAVTVDVWTSRWYGFPDKLTKKQYQNIVERIKRGSRHFKVKPAQYQATVWCKSLIKAGRTIKHFPLEDL